MAATWAVDQVNRGPRGPAAVSRGGARGWPRWRRPPEFAGEPDAVEKLRRARASPVGLHFERGLALWNGQTEPHPVVGFTAAGEAGIERHDGGGGRQLSGVVGNGVTARARANKAAGGGLRDAGNTMRTGARPFGRRSYAGDELGGAAFGHSGDGSYGVNGRARGEGRGRGAHVEPAEVLRWAWGGRTATNRRGGRRRPRGEARS
jgi:hypothetical protein